MKSYLKQFIAGIAALSILAMPFYFVGASNVALADAKSAVCQGVGFADGKKGAGCDEDAAANKVNSLVDGVINVFSWVVGVGAVLAIIYGGFRFITSAGDTAKLTTARLIIIYAVVGLVVVALAQTIVKFVLSKFVV